MKHVFDLESPEYQEKVKLCRELIYLSARIKKEGKETKDVFMCVTDMILLCDRAEEEKSKKRTKAVADHMSNWLATNMDIDVIKTYRRMKIDKLYKSDAEEEFSTSAMIIAYMQAESIGLDLEDLLAKAAEETTRVKNRKNYHTDITYISDMF